MSDFDHGWSVGHGGADWVVVSILDEGGHATLGLSPDDAESMALALLIAAKNLRKNKAEPDNVTGEQA